MAEKETHSATPRPCPHDCRQCSIQQQVYCTAQMTYNAFEQMNKMQEQLDSMAHHLADLGKKVDAIQSSEAELAIPMSEAIPDLFPTESTE